MKPRIVAIEDDPVLLPLLKELLTLVQYEVLTHDRGSDAHLLVRNVRPHAVILDLCLPDATDPIESGWRVLDRLVLDPATRDIPVIIASAAVDSIEAHRPTLLASYGVRILFKPYDFPRLLAMLAEAIARPPAKPQAAPSGRLRFLEKLTPRQREVAKLVALGHTNVEIAGQLMLESGTVANHVANILDRLNLTNRAQIATWVASHGSVDGGVHATVQMSPGLPRRRGVASKQKM